MAWLFIISFLLAIAFLICFSVRLGVNREYYYEVSIIAIVYPEMIIGGLMLMNICKRETPVKLHIPDYNECDFSEKDIKKIEESLPFKESPTVTWLNISRVYNEKIIH